ncbi:carbohydrate kinase [Neiella marina]|uniref:Carbohydrate kinase n=1 Tax=Neiella holothuriorum TaxID=2870530 RepID=A0ABS7EFY5_9GAMM|nr:carbohydrate kinase [Neiella holothuriorum]MBW8190597.1 carbohydrate kinase [Neiella holothuriorum]
MTALIPRLSENPKPTISCFGEVLWDVFPDERRVGGAPLNVCLRLNALGLPAKIISSVGRDALGAELLDFIKGRGVATDLVLQHPTKATSEVRVTLDSKGSASYQIVEDTAWDNVAPSDALLAAVSSADAFVFGSLVGRADCSYNTLQQMLKVANFKIFDVNLRAPHYTIEKLISLMEQADFIKLNDEELLEIAAHLGSPFHGLDQHLEFVAERTNTRFLCVTQGAHGAILKLDDQYAYHAGYHVKVADTVGAGDNFLGALIYQLCTHDKPQQMLNFACAVGSMVAQRAGATPELSLADIEHFINPIKTAET